MHPDIIRTLAGARQLGGRVRLEAVEDTLGEEPVGGVAQPVVRHRPPFDRSLGRLAQRLDVLAEEVVEDDGPERGSGHAAQRSVLAGDVPCAGQAMTRS